MTDDVQRSFDERGAQLLSTRVFFSSAEVLSRDELEQKQLITSRDLSGTWWSDFYLIPSEMHAGALYVAVSLHSHPPHDRQHWELTYALAPTASPPAFITHAAYDGAFPDNLRALIAKVPANNLTSLRARAHYVLDAARFPRASALLSSRSLTARDERVSLQPRSIEWNVHGAKHISSITIRLADDEQDQPHLAVEVRASVDVKLSETTRHDVDMQVWQELMSCVG